MASAVTALKILAMMVYGNSAPVPLTVVDDVQTCQAMASSATAINPKMDIKILCIPLPENAQVIGGAGQ